MALGVAVCPQVSKKMSVAVLDVVHRVFNSRGVRRALLVLRKPLGLAVVVLVAIHVRREWFLPGLIVSGVGAAAQWWCFGCIKTQKELAVNGPYRMVRNPMYLSRFFLVFGALMFTGNAWPAAAFVVLYYFYMVNRVKREEVKLEQAFGDRYREYCRQVRAFLPLRVYSGGKSLYFSREAFLRNHGQWNAIAVLAFYVVCWYMAFLSQPTGAR